jgi:hypothetical protein
MGWHHGVALAIALGLSGCVVEDDTRPGDNEGPANVTVGAACSEADLEEILARLGKASFDDGRTRMLESFAADRSFTCDQVVRLVGTFTFGDGQVRAVRILNPRIIDRQNFFKIYDVFTFDSDKDRVRAIETGSRR